MQFEQGQTAALPSDSSDRSKDKSDQKVIPLLSLSASFIWLAKGRISNVYNLLCSRHSVDLLKTVKLQGKVVWEKRYLKNNLGEIFFLHHNLNFLLSWKWILSCKLLAETYSFFFNMRKGYFSGHFLLQCPVYMLSSIILIVFIVLKAYVQQLESSRLKLTQLEQELQRARQQVCFGCLILFTRMTYHLAVLWQISVLFLWLTFFY